ncbi:hypothetical protein [Streptomyces sp. NPDC048825]|uniref:hypothetical protein n=1 Tax=Streptomyces sp. NPDC048825 TaxID=3365592 RepID=UPI0037212185
MEFTQVTVNDLLAQRRPGDGYMYLPSDLDAGPARQQVLRPAHTWRRIPSAVTSIPHPDSARWLLEVTASAAPADSTAFQEQRQLLRSVAGFDPASRTWFVRMRAGLWYALLTTWGAITGDGWWVRAARR